MRLVRWLLLVAVAALAVLAWAYQTAAAEPMVRRTSLELTGLAQPIAAVLISDIHVAGPDMPPRRLARIVRQINALKPDIVLIAGDLVSDKRLATHFYSLEEAVAPLGALRPRIGTYAVLGNHDHWRNARKARAALEGVGIVLLNNEAVKAGPLALGGVDDDFTGHDDLPATLAAMQELGGPGILLSHSPDPFPAVPRDVKLMLAGHTHCGQIRLPLVGAVSYMSEYGERYACGVVREAGKTLIVSAGLGTSILPLRLGAKPDLWVIELQPAS
jgi:predicted MPP superfamily phosphohydrolase